MIVNTIDSVTPIEDWKPDVILMNPLIEVYDEPILAENWI